MSRSLGMGVGDLVVPFCNEVSKITVDDEVFMGNRRSEIMAPGAVFVVLDVDIVRDRLKVKGSSILGWVPSFYLKRDGSNV